jgi:sodium/potassium-transporting ATPase subunit alpha
MTSKGDKDYVELEQELVTSPVAPRAPSEQADPIIILSKGQSSSNHLIATSRSGSAAELVRGKDGSVHVVRKSSGTDLNIAATRRISGSSQPNFTTVLGINPAPRSEEPVLSARDVLERTRGQGDFYEHMWTLEAISEKYETDINFSDPKSSKGLSDARASELLQEFGPNVLTPPARIPLWLLFLIQFTNMLNVLLIATGALCLMLYGINPSEPANLYLGIILEVVVVITCYESFSQEAKSDDLMEKFRAMVPEAASVIRGGEMKPISAPDIVVGDILRLKSGDKIPADCRVIFSQSLKVDQAMITGEAEPIDISVDAKHHDPLEAKNLVFSGSLVLEGACFAVAIRTGDGTLIGKMVDLTGDADKNTSTLQQDIVYFVRLLAVIALVQSALVFIVGIARGIDPIQVFVQGFIVIMVGNVPQGLPTTITTCLFIVADRMSERNVFVKKLDIIENLGSCTCICTDKTGTLTQNTMSVANVWVMNNRMPSKEFTIACGSRGSSLTQQQRMLIDCVCLNSRVLLETVPSKADPNVMETVPNGDATELGLWRFMNVCIPELAGKSVEEYRAVNRKVHEIPFNSKNKWQMTINTLESLGGKQIMFVKGGPDVLLQKCNRYMSDDGSIRPIDGEFQSIYDNVYESFGGNGERVLGFAMSPMAQTIEQEQASNPEFLEILKKNLVGGADCLAPVRDLVFCGLMTLRDPPREEVPQAIKECYTAGVKVG